MGEGIKEGDDMLEAWVGGRCARDLREKLVLIQRGLGIPCGRFDDLDCRVTI